MVTVPVYQHESGAYSSGEYLNERNYGDMDEGGDQCKFVTGGMAGLAFGTLFLGALIGAAALFLLAKFKGAKHIDTTRLDNDYDEAKY